MSNEMKTKLTGSEDAITPLVSKLQEGWSESQVANQKEFDELWIHIARTFNSYRNWRIYSIDQGLDSSELFKEAFKEVNASIRKYTDWDGITNRRGGRYV